MEGHHGAMFNVKESKQLIWLSTCLWNMSFSSIMLQQYPQKKRNETHHRVQQRVCVRVHCEYGMQDEKERIHIQNILAIVIVVKMCV